MSKRGTKPTPQEVAEQIRAFVERCGKPVLLEAGASPLPLEASKFAIEVQRDRCLLQVWGEAGNAVRRIAAVRKKARGRLDLAAHGFGGVESVVTLIDEARRGTQFAAAAEHRRFDPLFERILRREFPGWAIRNLTSAPDLEHSLSPQFTRGLLTQGQQAWAVIGAGPAVGRGEADQILTFGLIWHDHLLRRQRRLVLRGLKVFLPAGSEQTTANRLAFLDRGRLEARLFRIAPDGAVTEADLQDFGNLRSELLPCLPASDPQEPVAGWLRELLSNVDVEMVPCADGLRSLRVRGLEFARAGRGVMTYGLEEAKAVHEAEFPRVVALARELGRMRSPDAPDVANPLYRRFPERWLESQVRRRLSVLDGTLLRQPIYQQTPAVAGADRGVVDLLAAGRDGRIAVIEIKASEDPHLPLQALDYWMRVRWHLARGDFARRGYFPELTLSPAPPRLLLTAPALEFHPTTETILSYLSREVEVEQVGVGADWRRRLQVVFRKRGSRRFT